ncbi:MAG: phytoene/squalene synthase family protein [Hyphomonadaceae bacterium]|nr:phytoene/squalene synthase family protein [Hyphomonadaceae bacterium]
MDGVTKHGHRSIKAGSGSFALASLVLPPALRDDASMLYAWCRYCDDVIDGQVMGHDQIADYKTGQAERLENLRKKTQSALNDQPTDDPVFEGLTRVVKTHDIDHRHPFDLLKGFEMDATNRIYETVEDILDYSYHVAGVVGVMMANVMGVRDDATLDRASDLGLAFQLTNIARDVIDDARAGRVFLPGNLLIKHGAPTDAGELAKRENRPAAFEVTVDLLNIAENYYASARVGIRELTFRCAWAISAALAVYRAIGEKLRDGGPESWEGRVSLSGGKKTALVIGALGPTLKRGQIADVSRGKFYTRPRTA